MCLLIVILCFRKWQENDKPQDIVPASWWPLRLIQVHSISFSCKCWFSDFCSVGGDCYHKETPCVFKEWKHRYINVILTEINTSSLSSGHRLSPEDRLWCQNKLWIKHELGLREWNLPQSIKVKYFIKGSNLFHSGDLIVLRALFQIPCGISVLSL